MDIAIRRAEPDDFEGVWRIFQDESAYSGTFQLPFPSREVWRKRMAEPAEGHYMLLACVGDEIVGNAGLHAVERTPRRAHVMSVGMSVPSPWQGKGVGKALMAGLLELADNWLHVFRLELTVFADNERAIALYQKSGFVKEGTMRAYGLRAGRYADAYLMARIRLKPAPDL